MFKHFLLSTIHLLVCCRSMLTLLLQCQVNKAYQIYCYVYEADCLSQFHTSFKRHVMAMVGWEYAYVCVVCLWCRNSQWNIYQGRVPCVYFLSLAYASLVTYFFIPLPFPCIRLIASCFLFILSRVLCRNSFLRVHMRLFSPEVANDLEHKLQ
jgi:hypothetical protein